MVDKLTADGVRVPSYIIAAVTHKNLGHCAVLVLVEIRPLITKAEAPRQAGKYLALGSFERSIFNAGATTLAELDRVLMHMEQDLEKAKKS